ncbi:hypothetical protein GE09DRAFT_1261384 [Coniochaeta sp. 2T2.1]|nr:hypothetical protein GE09DRAFT_1261384 [Coniochaeta sp. 2T2.1]
MFRFPKGKPTRLSSRAGNFSRGQKDALYESLPLNPSATSPISNPEAGQAVVDGNDHPQHHRQRMSFLCVSAAFSIIAGILLVAVCLTSVARLNTILDDVPVRLTEENHLAHIHEINGTLGDCGNSLAAARSNGCLFNPISWAWQPPACYNKELVDDFLTVFDWHFYPNNATLAEEEFPREKFLRGDYLMAWSTWAWHMYHCSYSWRKFHTALAQGRPLDDDVLDMEHTKHCSTAILLRDTDPELRKVCEADPEGCKVTQMYVRFNKCKYHGVGRFRSTSVGVEVTE